MSKIVKHYSILGLGTFLFLTKEKRVSYYKREKIKARAPSCFANVKQEKLLLEKNK